MRQTASSYLDNPLVGDLLAELFAASKDDAEVIQRARTTVAGWSAEPTVAQMSDLCAHAGLPVKPEVGRLLYMLARILQPKIVVEFGTSFGVSLIYLASALRDNGGGLAIGSEMSASKIAKARESLQRAGLNDFARIVEGDARETLAEVQGPIDLVLLDGWKELYLPVLEVLVPKMRPGTVIVADNLSMLPQDYLDRVRSGGSGFVSISLPLGDGIEFSLRLS